MTTRRNKVGAYQTLEAGRTCNVSGACHWTMDVAASNGHGKLYADAYSVRPGHVRVAGFADQDPVDLAGVPISVGYQSGSHYATIQGLEHISNPIRSTCRSTMGFCSAEWSF